MHIGNAPATAGGPTHVAPSKRAQMIHVAQWCALPENQAKFHYTMEHPGRSVMFHMTLAELYAAKTVSADCSQWYASIAKDCGVKGLTADDYTGTLLQKGKHVIIPKAGDCVIFGGGTGEHAAMLTYNGFTIGFGHSPGAPNRVLLTDLIAYFAHSHPGVRYLAFVP